MSTATAISFVVVIGSLALLAVTRELERREFLAAFDRERKEWTRERQLLLNRIKPETAQFVPDPDAPPAQPAVRFDDDDDFWSAIEQTEPKEALAERMMAEEIHGGA